MAKQTALVTGASTGIGYALAKRFAEGGYDLVIIARNQARLDEVAAELEDAYGVSVTVLAMDLAARSAPDEVFRFLQGASLTIDVLVNNAGFGFRGPFAQEEVANALEMIQLNVTALVHLTGLLLPGMLERRNGKILNVGSTASYQPGPFMAVYYATKAFVLHFSEAIGHELRGTGVTVTALNPGPTESEFHHRASDSVPNLMRRGMAMDARRVAEVGYDALMKGRSVVIPGFKNNVLSVGPRFLPRSVVLRVVNFLNRDARTRKAKENPS